VSESVLRIEAIGRHGDGIAETAAGKVFVPLALPGETVRAEVDGKRARLIDVVAASPERIAPICPYFGDCGGCSAQHLGKALYRQWKRDAVVTALSHRGLAPPVDDLLDAHGRGRRRATFHVRFEKGKAQAGFMRARSRSLRDLDRCPILEPALQPAPDIARRLAQPFAMRGKPFDVRITATASGLDCAVLCGGEPDLDARMDIAGAADYFDLARVTVAGEPVLERRPPRLDFGGVDVAVPPGGFLQATQAGEEALAGLVLDHCRGAVSVADLFCGIGPFALRLARTARVLAADNDDRALAAMTRAHHRAQGLKPLTAEPRDLIRNPFAAEDLSGLDAVVFDPPRAGAEEQAREIALSNVKTAIAVSCDPATLARDVGILVDGGFAIERVTPIDQFRYASHVEAVALLRRG